MPEATGGTDNQKERRTEPLPLAAVGWRPRRLLLVTGPLCQTLDLTILGSLFVALVLRPPGAALHERGIGMFMAMKVTFPAMLLVVLCLFTWRMILRSVGVYTPALTGSFAEYLFRLLIAVNSCAFVVGLVQLVLRRPHVWHLIEVFWGVSLVSMGGVRAAILLEPYSRLRLRRSTATDGS